MKLVIDTSIVFSLFKSDSFTNRFLQNNKLELFAPETLLEELNKYSNLISIKSEVAENKVKEDINLLPRIINFRTPSEWALKTAEKSIAHRGDSHFLALALELKIPVWSNDAHFKEQILVRVFTTRELSDFLTDKII